MGKVLQTRQMSFEQKAGAVKPVCVGEAFRIQVGWICDLGT
jgi:hypothetical protein